MVKFYYLNPGGARKNFRTKGTIMHCTMIGPYQEIILYSFNTRDPLIAATFFQPWWLMPT